LAQRARAHDAKDVDEARTLLVCAQCALAPPWWARVKCGG